MSLGQYMRELRDKRDLSLREFAKKLELSAAFVSDIELGRRFPSDKVLSEIADVLGTTVADLKAHDDRPPVEEMKRLIASNPSYALAFRTAADSKLSPEKLIELIKEAQGRGSVQKK